MMSTKHGRFIQSVVQMQIGNTAIQPNQSHHQENDDDDDNDDISKIKKVFFSLLSFSYALFTSLKEMYNISSSYC